MASEYPSGRELAARRTLLVMVLILSLAAKSASLLFSPSFEDAEPALSGLSAPDVCFLDATAVETGKVRVFKTGTTVAEALSEMGLSYDPRGSGFCTPRAGRVILSDEGWTVVSMSQSERWVWGIPMELNRCGYEDLLRLPGIGPRLADKIHAFLLAEVWVPSTESLLRVRGVGSGRMETLRRFLEVEGERSPCGASAGRAKDEIVKGPRQKS